MRVGVPQEIKKNEHRIGLTPTAVREYVAHGHTVLVQTGAGDGAGVLVFRPKAGIGKQLVQIFDDGERFPDQKITVFFVMFEHRYQARRGMGEDLFLDVGALEPDHGLVEGDAGAFQRQPTAKAPRRGCPVSHHQSEDRQGFIAPL